MFGLDPLNEQNLLDDATRRGHENNPDPGLFGGLWSAPLSGAAEGAYKAASLFNRGVLAPVAKTFVGPVDSMMGFPVANWIDDQNNKRAAMLDLVKPDPLTTGALAKGVHGIFTQAPLMAGLVATGGLAGLAALPGWAAGVEGESAFQEARHNKLDPGTSFGMGAITALSTWAGMKVPMHTSAYLPAFTGATGITIKEGILPSLVAGAAANVPVGMITRGATGDWLRYNGFPEMADNFKTFDQEAIVSDLVMGAGFGALGHYGPLAYDRYQKWRKGSALLDSDQDAAFTINNNHSLERGPAIPTDPATRAANYEAKLGALRAAIEGKPFIVGDGITNGNWLHDPSNEHISLLGSIGIAEHMKGSNWDADHTGLITEAERLGIDTSPLTGGGEYQGPRGEPGAQASKSANQIAWEASPEHADAVKFLTEKWTREGMSPEEAARQAKETIDKSGPHQDTAGAPGLNIPGAVLGHMSRIKVEGIYHPAQFILVDAAQHQATMNKGENQFRSRQDKVSQAQIEGIANAPDVNMLLDSPLMDWGAPTMDRHGNIVGGNGRVEGLSRAYDRGNGHEYSEPLKQLLPRFGIDPAAADGMKKPVLMRAFVNEMDIKRTAMASNEGGGLRMTDYGQAGVDAERLPDIRGLVLKDNGSINSASNRVAINEWARKFPLIEANTLVNGRGELSTGGERRFQNAILHRAFGDSPTLEMLIETRDPEIKNVALALTRSGPHIAAAKAMIEAGDLHPLDITSDLTAAVEKMAELRRSGTTVRDYLNQSEMFAANQLSQEARKILLFLTENNRSVKAMSEMVNSFFDQVQATGKPNAPNAFDTAPPSKAEILDRAIAATGRRVKSGELVETAPAADQQASADTLGFAADAAYAAHDNEQSIVNPIDPNATPNEKVRQLNALTEENRPVVQDLMDKIDGEVGTTSGSNKKADDKIIEKSLRPSILDEKPWYRAEHIRDSFRFKTVLDSIDQLPKAVAILRQELDRIGGEIIKADLEKMVSPKEFGWRIAVFDLKMPNGQLVEYYLPLKRMEEAKKNGGHQIFESVRNLEVTPKTLPEISAAWDKSTEHYNQAFNEQLVHEGKTMADVRAAVDETQAGLSKPSSERASASSASASGPLTREYPSSKSPALDAGAGDLQFPRKDLTAEKSPGPNSQATLEPVSDLNAMNNPSDITSSSARILQGGAESGKGIASDQAIVAQAVETHGTLPVPADTGLAEPQILPAAEAFKNAVANEAESKNNAQAFEAAITCLLRG